MFLRAFARDSSLFRSPPEQFRFLRKLPCSILSASFCGKGGIPTKSITTQYPKILLANLQIISEIGAQL
jgi:hypothetical protein